ncbi:hypothetical protein S245_044990 [Arachis hypogaea]
MQRQVERTAAVVSGVTAVSEEGSADSKLTTPMKRTESLRSYLRWCYRDWVGLAEELMVVWLICSDYDGTLSSNFEPSSTGAYKGEGRRRRKKESCRLRCLIL